jgi:hypothetical protein
MAKAPPPSARSARRTVIAASAAPDVQAEQWSGHTPPPSPTPSPPFPPPPPPAPAPAPSTDAITQLLLDVLTKANQQIPGTGLTGPALAVAQRFQKLSAQLSTLADPVDLRALRDVD